MKRSVDADAGGMNRQSFLEENQVEWGLVFDAHSKFGTAVRNIDVLVRDGKLILFHLRQELVFRDLAAFVIFSPMRAILLSRSRFSLSQ